MRVRSNARHVYSRRAGRLRQRRAPWCMTTIPGVAEVARLRASRRNPNSGEFGYVPESSHTSPPRPRPRPRCDSSRRDGANRSTTDIDAPRPSSVFSPHEWVTATPTAKTAVPGCRIAAMHEPRGGSAPGRPVGLSADREAFTPGMEAGGTLRSHARQFAIDSQSGARGGTIASPQRPIAPGTNRSPLPPWDAGASGSFFLAPARKSPLGVFLRARCRGRKFGKFRAMLVISLVAEPAASGKNRSDG